MGELAKTGPSALDILNGAANIEKVDEAAIINQIVTTPNFLANLAIATGSSKSVTEKRIAYAGDYVLSGQVNLGQTVKIVPITWRCQAREYLEGAKPKARYGDSAYYCKDLGPDMTAYNEFVKKPRDPELKAAIQEGIDFLVYIPDKNVFASYYVANTKRQAIESLRMFSGRLMSITAKAEQGKRGTYYNVIVTLENRALTISKLEIPGTTLTKDIALDLDTFQKNMDLFLKPATVSSDTTEDVNN